MLSLHPPVVWIGFTAIILVLLVLDLGVLNRRAHELTAAESSRWSAGLVTLALLFCAFLWYQEGRVDALQFLTGYVIEFSLSVDNLFVFLLILHYFAVPAASQPKVLKWGILGAIIMRAVMIGLGTVLISRFAWILYVFGAVLIVTGLRMVLLKGEEQLEPEKNPIVRLARRLLPFSKHYHHDQFIIREHTVLMATPLLLVLLVIEWSDLVFAIDSIPAIFSITKDPFIVYSSNIFAILGLRAVFFLLASMLDKFRYLKPGVALILVFIGVKMLIAFFAIEISIQVSLAVVVGTLAASVLASMRSAAHASDGSSLGQG